LFSRLGHTPTLGEVAMIKVEDQLLIRSNL
jgi:hypothetical protein